MNPFHSRLHSSRLWIVAFALAAHATSMAAPACAQRSDDDRARQHFDAGVSYYEQRRYEDAEREFGESYRLSGRAELLVNIATSRERRLDFAGAARSLEQYLAAQPDAEDRVTIETRIQSLRQQAAQPQTEPRDDSGPSTAGIVLMVGAGVLGAVTLGTGIASQVMYDQLVQACGPDRTCPAERRDDAGTAEALAITSTVALVATGAAAGVGILLLVLDTGSHEPRAGEGHLVPGPGLVGLGYEISF
jgi:tetratricopeptide (TPR) repeat protein